MTELRRRMDEAMIVRGFAARTRETYLDVVKGLARYYHRSPDLITDAEIQACVLYLIRDRQRSWSTCNIVVCGLRCFYHETLQRDRTTFTIPSPRQPGTLPALLSREEVQRLIAHAPHLPHRTMLLTTYAAGLRLSEVLHLRIGDIETIVTMNGSPGQRNRRYQTLTPCVVRTSPLATGRMAPGRGVGRVPMAGDGARPGDGTGDGTDLRPTAHTSKRVPRRVGRCVRSGATAAHQDSSPFKGGGARAGRAAGTSGGSPRCRRICAVTAPASRSATRRSRPPHRGHASTSTSNARRIRSAQRRPARPRDVAAAASDGAPEDATPDGACGTTSARHAACAARTP